MKIIAYADQSFEPLKKRYMDSYQDDYPVCFDFRDAKKGSTAQQRWGHMIGKYKVQKILEHLHSASDDYLIFSDADIQYFGSLKPEINRLISEGIDLAFQREVTGGRNLQNKTCMNCNTGFILMKRSEPVFRFWKDASDICTEPGKTSQYAANHLLKADPGRLKWTHFSRKIWAYSDGRLLGVPSDIILHHANCIIGCENKLKQMKAVAGIVKIKRLLRLK